MALAVSENGEAWAKELVPLAGELAEDLFACLGNLDADFTAILFIALGRDQLSGSEPLDCGGHRAAGKADFGGDLIDRTGAFFLQPGQNGQVGSAKLVSRQKGALLVGEEGLDLGDQGAGLVGFRILFLHEKSLGKKELCEKPSFEKLWRSMS